MGKVLIVIISLVVLSQGQETNQTLLSQGESIIEDAIFSLNNYVVLLTELVTQISKFITMSIYQVQAGHFDVFNFTKVHNESQMLSCTANENNTLINLLNNNSQTFNHCLQNVEPMSTQLLNTISNLLLGTSDTIRDILQKINSCMNSNMNVFELAECIYNLQQPITDDLRNVTNHLNDTIYLALKVVPEVSNQTTSCIISTANDFLLTGHHILVNYYNCLSN